MGTRSCIILKVRKEDIGSIIRFDKSKLPVPLEKWIDKTDSGEVWRDERGKEQSKPIEVKNTYIGIYCHWDGSPSGVGKVLKEKFTDYAKILNLIAGGFCSAIEVKGIRHYANRKIEAWNNIIPVQGKNAADVYHQIDCQYVYVYDETRGGWHWKEAYPKYSYNTL